MTIIIIIIIIIDIITIIIIIETYHSLNHSLNIQEIFKGTAVINMLKRFKRE